ncbi:MAG: S1 RNA-binding domain-containing protein, partial [Planctomycetota bacterium]|nr:S1 RNA-binding domain-containing protein [Planctomycetota bacterium]
SGSTGVPPVPGEQKAEGAPQPPVAEKPADSGRTGVPPVPGEQKGEAAPQQPVAEKPADSGSTGVPPVPGEQKAEGAPQPPEAKAASQPAAAGSAPPATSVRPPTTSKAEALVKPFINPEKGVKDLADALAGARDIVAERIAEDAACRKIARDLFHGEGKFTTKARENVDLSKGKYAAFAGVSEPLAKVSAHRLLLALRGAAEKQLTVALEPPRGKILQQLKAKILINPDAALRPELVLGIEECFDRLLGPALDNELRQELKRRADQEVIATCSRNLRALLLQPPLGPQPVLALDPAPGVGLKIAVLDGTGKLVAHAILSPEKGEGERKAAAEALAGHIKEHGIKVVALGDGAGSRETDLFVHDVLKTHELPEVRTLVVRLHGASQVGREDLDVEPAARGAVALGRYLQDPLAELVRLDPATIAVGQHQHEVDQGHLRQKLDEVLESCVCEVGADANTASAALLRHAAGLNLALATALVETRKAKGPYKSREELREVPGADAKAFEQCAGFVRVSGSANPLDTTAIHPEAYSMVEALAASLNSTVKDLMGNADPLSKLDLAKLRNEQCGDFTLRDIVEELKHPNRDVRGAYVTPEFSPDVRDIADLKEGMILNGLVTNLTAFGAFVDIGVHQDGLVHISAITRKFIRDASEVLSVGQRVKVKVLSADVERKRISLSMKELEPPPPPRR